MKKNLVPIITVSLAAAFAAGPAFSAARSFAHARPALAAFLTIAQDQERPTENPPNRPVNNNEEKPKPEKQPKPQQQAKQDNKMTQKHNDQNKKSVHAQQN